MKYDFLIKKILIFKMWLIRKHCQVSGLLEIMFVVHGWEDPFLWCNCKWGDAHPV